MNKYITKRTTKNYKNKYSNKKYFNKNYKTKNYKKSQKIFGGSTSPSEKEKLEVAPDSVYQLHQPDVANELIGIIKKLQDLKQQEDLYLQQAQAIIKIDPTVAASNVQPHAEQSAEQSDEQSAEQSAEQKTTFIISDKPTVIPEFISVKGTSKIKIILGSGVYSRMLCDAVLEDDFYTIDLKSIPRLLSGGYERFNFTPCQQFRSFTPWVIAMEENVSSIETELLTLIQNKLTKTPHIFDTKKGPAPTLDWKNIEMKDFMHYLYCLDKTFLDECIGTIFTTKQEEIEKKRKNPQLTETEKINIDSELQQNKINHRRIITTLQMLGYYEVFVVNAYGLPVLFYRNEFLSSWMSEKHKQQLVIEKKNYETALKSALLKKGVSSIGINYVCEKRGLIRPTWYIGQEPISELTLKIPQDQIDNFMVFKEVPEATSYKYVFCDMYTDDDYGNKTYELSTKSAPQNSIF